MPPRERDSDADLESGGTSCEQVGNSEPVFGTNVAKTFSKICTGFMSVDGSFKGEKEEILSSKVSNIGGVSMENVTLLIDEKVEGDGAADLVENKSGKERRKTMSAKKKPPRPPRPPKALSLDAADQKLIKEISELAMVKRARSERMKALKRMKAAKVSTSIGNLFAMIFTILFGLVVIFQGMSPGRSSSVSFQGSPESAQATAYGFLAVHYHRNTPARDTSNSGSSSSSLVQQVSDSAPSGNARRDAGSSDTNKGTNEGGSLQ